MRWFYILSLRLRSLFRRNRVEAELTEEFEYHLNQQTERYVAGGMNPEEAARKALRQFDGPEQRKEECRDSRGSIMDSFLQDLRFGARALRQHPGFTVVAILSLALGIGFNTAVFSLLNSLLLRKLPVHDPDHLYQLLVTHRSATHNRFSYPDFEKLRKNFDVIDDIAVWAHFTPAIEVDGAELPVHYAALVSGTYFRVLGVKPVLGRLLDDGDDTAGGSRVAVIGHGFWQSQFSGRKDVIGKVVRIGKGPVTIVGVTPPGFGGAEVDYPRDIMLPLHAVTWLNGWDGSMLNAQGAYVFSTLLRLKPGVTMEAARPILRENWPRMQLGREPRPGERTQRLDLQPGGSGLSNIRDEFSRALLVLMALVAVVLLIVCANIANLLLARSMTRRKEMAVRLAIGAGRGRLIRQAVTESGLLAVLGAIVGTVSAIWLTRILLLFLPEGEAGFLRFHLDGRMLFFVAGVTAATVLVAGLLPAFHAVRVPLMAAMNDAARGAGGRRSRLSTVVVAAQVAACLALVVGALLFAHSLSNLLRIDVGFRQDDLLVVEANPGNVGLRDERAADFRRRVMERLEAIPGMESVAGLTVIPISGGAWWNAPIVPGFTPTPGENVVAYLNAVSPGYFGALGIRILEGREFTLRDTRESQRVVIVNEAFAKHFFPGRSAVGQYFSISDDRAPQPARMEIVGVAANTKYMDPREAPKDLVYFSLDQTPGMNGGVFAVRPKGGVDHERTSREIRTAIEQLHPGIGIGVRSFRTVFDRAARRDRMVASLSGALGLVGVLLACIGLYGIMSQSVAARVGEIGIRTTLGARSWQVEWLLLREALLVVGAGLAIGVPLALGLGRIAEGLLYNLTSADPLALGGSVALMIGITLAAAWLPARRATHRNPMAALRRS